MDKVQCVYNLESCASLSTRQAKFITCLRRWLQAVLYVRTYIRDATCICMYLCTFTVCAYTYLCTCMYIITHSTYAYVYVRTYICVCIQTVSCKI